MSIEKNTRGQSTTRAPRNEEEDTVIEAKRELGFAVIGCGYWGTNYVRVLNDLEGSRVAAVCDQQVERLEQIQRQYERVAVTTDIGEALERSDVDAVVVCTQASSHYQITRHALMAGKHVLVEKPIATTVPDAQDLVVVAQSTGSMLMVGHTFIYNSAIRLVKDYVDQGELGRLFYLNARRTNLGPVRHDVNALWDLAPHDVSIFNYLLGSAPDWVSAVGAKVLRKGQEDVGFISLGYPGGIVGHIHVSWADPHKSREVVVVGSDKRIVFNDMKAPEQIWVFENGMSRMEAATAANGNAQVQLTDGGVVSPSIDSTPPLTNQCMHFIECVHNGRNPLTGGRQGLDVVRVLEAVDRSIERNGSPVDVAPIPIVHPNESETTETQFVAS